MKKNKIFVACDSKNISKIKKIISETQNSKIKVGYKFGLEFLVSLIILFTFEILLLSQATNILFFFIIYFFKQIF